MPGIIKTSLHQVKSLYLRTLLFNNDTRAWFYATLREYLGSHFPLLGVFDHMQRHGNNPAIQEIARLSKRAIRNNQPFATHYYATGLFTEQESKLLMLGERYDCMDTVTELLLDRDDQVPAMLQILSGSVQWIFMSLIMTAMSIYTLPYLKNYTSGYALFFAYVTFAKSWWPQLAGLAAATFILYHWCMYRLTGPLRRALAACGCFRVYAILTERRFLNIGGVLVAARLPPDEYLRLMETTFSGHRLLGQALQKSRARLKEASLLQALEDVLSPYSYTHVLACTPNQTQDEIARGFHMAARMLNIRLGRTIKAWRSFYTLLFLSASIAITIPFALVSMGMGIEI
ncbi:MAG: hypothetical protein F4147_09055 [Gammaproteobacteria bacterium]|nr:hypothetical protein [Gammaproteobacteria bacterium]